MSDAAAPSLTFSVRADALPPVDRLAVGKPVQEVVDLLPRIFNLCRAAQETALRLAFGMAPGAADPAEEIRREHMMRLALILPRHFGMPGLPMQREALLEGCPETPQELASWMSSGRGAAPLMARLAEAFAPGEACATLPEVDQITAFAAAPVENSAAMRRADHPVMRHIEAQYGRGPLWRCMGRLYDLAGDFPAAHPAGPGRAICPAARGLYAVDAAVENGVVTWLARMTPTDHLLAEGGMLAQTLASLPGDKEGLAPLVLDVLDPCFPVRLTKADAHA